MKKLLLISVLFVSGLVNSQIIDTNNFNYPLLEKMILQKINEYRKTKKLSPLVFSDTLKTYYSVKSSTVNAIKDSAFHRSNIIINNNMKVKIYKEYYNKTNGKSLIENPLYVGLKIFGEVICKSYGVDETYNIMATNIFNSWLSSPKHKDIIELPYIEKISFFSCSVKKSKNGNYYTTVNFISLNYN